MLLKTAYNAHPVFEETMLTLKKFNKTSPKFREMMFTHHSTGTVAMLDLNLQLTMSCGVYCKKNIEWATTSILLPRSVVELKPGLTGASMSESFPILYLVK